MGRIRGMAASSRVKSRMAMSWSGILSTIARKNREVQCIKSGWSQRGMAELKIFALPRSEDSRAKAHKAKLLDRAAVRN